VVLLDDCFTTFNTPEVGIAAVRLIEAAGYHVRLAGLECCGRPAISKGLLGYAHDLARRNVERLAPFVRDGMPILGLEPSCLATLVDDARDFRLGPDAEVVASGSFLVDAWLADPSRVPDLPLRASGDRVLLHGHCHQKAIFGTSGTLDALRRIPGLSVSELDSGCCGMAGSFGYERGHYDVSVSLARRVLIPAAEADPEAKLVAPGFSCRSQLHGISGIEAVHPVQFLAEHLSGSGPGSTA
jgi:Fe-S oxidoreductase